MIISLNNFLSSDELKLAIEYWKIKEQSLKPCNQEENAVAEYADILSETFLKMKQPIVEKAVGEKLIPTYSYSRMYYKGSELKRHVDRPPCEISVSLSIFGTDNWKLWFHKLIKERVEIVDTNVQPTSITIKAGDGAMYEGCQYQHWRDPYDGEKGMQIFIHYIRANGRYKAFTYDSRKILGIKKKDTDITKIWSNV